MEKMSSLGDLEYDIAEPEDEISGVPQQVRPVRREG